jgi:hypothetical protein
VVDYYDNAMLNGRLYCVVLLFALSRHSSRSSRECATGWRQWAVKVVLVATAPRRHGLEREAGECAAQASSEESGE